MVYPVMTPRLLMVGFHILLPFILFSFHVDHAMSTNDYINSRCSVTANYTNGSAFEVNMRSLFFTLTNDALPTGFSNATTGHGLDRVYGLVQCRGDVDEDTCKVCVSNSTQQVVKYCPRTMDAILWYEKCQLRYSNTNFFGHLNVEDSGSWYWTNTVQDPKAFNQTLDSLLKNLTYQATTGPSRFMFATGNIPYGDLQTIFGLVQCTGDTSLADCKQCLDDTRSQIPTTCGAAHGCEIATGSCRVRYDTELFYATTTSLTPSPRAPPSNSSPSPSPPPPPADSSPLSSGASNTTSEKPNHSTATSVAMITVITFALTSTMMPSWL